MKVHLCSAASSPGCAYLAYKQLATDGQARLKHSTAEFNFYVNDGLMSLTSENVAMELVKDARESCSAGKLSLQKLMSNSVQININVRMF